MISRMRRSRLRITLSRYSTSRRNRLLIFRLTIQTGTPRRGNSPGASKFINRLTDHLHAAAVVAVVLVAGALIAVGVVVVVVVATAVLPGVFAFPLTYSGHKSLNFAYNSFIFSFPPLLSSPPPSAVSGASMMAGNWGTWLPGL